MSTMQADRTCVDVAGWSCYHPWNIYNAVIRSQANISLVAKHVAVGHTNPHIAKKTWA